MGASPRSRLKTWLLKRRLTLVDEAKLNQIATEMGSRHALSNVDVLKSAKLAEAKQVIFVDTDVSKSLSYDIFGQPRYNASLYIRAIDVDSGEIDWNGKARSIQTFSNLTEGIDQLTFQALATAWGLRQPGMTTAPSICLPGENVMVAAEPSTARYILATAKAF